MWIPITDTTEKLSMCDPKTNLIQIKFLTKLTLGLLREVWASS